jgi:putative membrane protein
MRRLLLTAAVCAGVSALLPLGGSAATGVSRLCGLDRQYLQTDVQGSLFEIAGGRIAEQRSTNGAVRQLGAVLVRDHSKTLTEAGRLMRAFGMKVPGTPDPVQHWQLHQVSTLTGAAFDRQYTWLEVSDHQVDIEDAQNEARYGCNTAVRGLARKELPVLRMHFRLAAHAQSASRA